MSQTLKSIFGGHQELRALLNKAQTLADLHRQFAAAAPAYMAENTQILGLRLGTLSVAVTHSTLAAKLRQIAPDLVIRMQNSGCEISSLRVKVQVSFDRPNIKPGPHKLSRTAQGKLEELGTRLDDSPLGNALKRLAQK